MEWKKQSRQEAQRGPSLAGGCSPRSLGKPGPGAGGDTATAGKAASSTVREAGIWPYSLSPISCCSPSGPGPWLAEVSLPGADPSRGTG